MCHFLFFNFHATLQALVCGFAARHLCPCVQARLDAALKQNTEDTNQHQQVAQGREQCIQQLNARVSTLQEQLSHAQEQDLARQRSLAEAQTVVEEQVCGSSLVTSTRVFTSTKTRTLQ